MATKEIVLITGASGLIGSRLKARLLADGHEVRVLGRNNKGKENEGKYDWNPAENEMDERALKDVTVLVHLAGESVAGKLWTKERKEAILQSRIQSSRLLVETITRTGYKPRKFIAASAVGYYGSFTSDKIFHEEDLPAHDFLADVCVQWEKENTNFSLELNIPSVILRIGVVLAKEGGALQEIVKPMRFLMGAVLGSGKQWVAWIHIDDLVGIIHFSVADEKAQGIYNAVAPAFTNFKELTYAAAKSMNRFVSPIPVPKPVIKAALGEQAVIVLEGSRVSSEKIREAGYVFQFEQIQAALDDLLK